MITVTPYINTTRLLSNVVAPCDPRLIATNLAFSANLCCATRVTIPYSGTLHDFAVYIGATSGNLDAGIYDTAATTRTKLWSSGSTATGTANGWQVVGDPNLGVAAGDQLDFAVSSDNGTTTFGRANNTPNLSTCDLPANFWPSPLGGANLLTWSRATSFPLPGPTILESSITALATNFVWIARLTPA